jgi:hypothetical protein
MSVADDFRAFRRNYIIGTDLIASIGNRYRTITRRLNKDFWNTDSDVSHSLYVGSYGRDTAAKGISDLDIAFRLPFDVYERYKAYLGNGPSALLQAVRNSLQTTYPFSRLGGDGQVVVLQFADGITFEILPVFGGVDGPWIYPDSNSGGSWKTCNPKLEIDAVHDRNLAVNRNLKALCRMMRVWKDYNSVPMTGALIDALAYQFVGTWEHREKSFMYHDWMARDFLLHLNSQDRDKQYWLMPGSGSRVYRTGPFGYKAGIDYRNAVEACAFQDDADALKRRLKWRTVFGPIFPI